MRNFQLAIAFTLSAAITSTSAEAQVLITELHPNPTTPQDAEEFVEIENVGTTSVSIAGWTLSDTSNGMEVMTRWAFPAGAAIQPGEVLVITRQSIPFTALFTPLRASYELGQGADDPLVPNLTPSTGTTFALVNANTGDAVFLRDAQGMIVSYIEYGNDLAAIPGAPASTNNMNVPPGASYVRVDDTGSSATDFVLSSNPTPFVGFEATGAPLISGTRSDPRHVAFGDTYRVQTRVSDADGISDVEIYLTTATSSRGAAVDNYVGVSMTSSAGTATAAVYVFAAPVENLAPGLGFNEPMDFHSRYIRYYIQATDTLNGISRDPADATESSTNTAYHPTFVQNVMPRLPSPIEEVREGDAQGDPIYAGHSVRVEGVALSAPDLLQPGRTNFTLQDNSGAAIAYFNGGAPRVDFEAGARLQVTGELGSFMGMTQIAGTSTVIVLPGTGPVPTTTLTIAQILAGGESYEAELIHIRDVDFENPRDTWPDDPDAPGTWNVTVSDGTGSIQLRITSSTDLFGGAAPQFGFHVTGVLGQRGMAWQLFPRSTADVIAKPMPPMPDAGVADTGLPPGADSGVRADGGVQPRADAGSVNPPEDEGCGCTTAASSDRAATSLIALLAIGVLLALRRCRN